MEPAKENENQTHMRTEKEKQLMKRLSIYRKDVLSEVYPFPGYQSLQIIHFVSAHLLRCPLSFLETAALLHLYVGDLHQETDQDTHQKSSLSVSCSPTVAGDHLPLVS